MGGGGAEGSNEKEERGHLPWEESCAGGHKMGIPAAGGEDSAFLMFAGGTAVGWGPCHGLTCTGVGRGEGGCCCRCWAAAPWGRPRRHG